MLSDERRTAARTELTRVCSEVNELAAEFDRASLRRAFARSRAWRILAGLITTAGVVLIAGGVWVGVHPLIAMLERGRADQTALAQWRRVGSAALAGSAPAAVQPPATGASGGCGGASAGDAYALLSFPGLAQGAYSGVAGDGDWDLLRQRSVVHLHGSAAPGTPGNSIIAFHREPDFKDIDRLGVGAPVVVQDRSCRSWTYVVRQRWVLAPDRVTQLGPTRDAALTLVTCDPWFRDTDRIVWRATLGR